MRYDAPPNHTGYLARPFPEARNAGRVLPTPGPGNDIISLNVHLIGRMHLKSKGSLMKRTLLLSATLLGIALAPLQAAGDAAKGKELYTKKCQMCHGADGAGTPAMVKKYEGKLPKLASADIQKKADADLKKAIGASANHKALAKTVTDADLDNVIAYVKTIK